MGIGPDLVLGTLVSLASSGAVRRSVLHAQRHGPDRSPRYRRGRRNSYYANKEVIIVFGGAWVLGHLLAYVLLGIALARSHVVPAWAGVLMVVAVPVIGPIAYGTNSMWIQVAGFILIAVSSATAAAAMLTGAHEGTSAPARLTQPVSPA